MSRRVRVTSSRGRGQELVGDRERAASSTGGHCLSPNNVLVSAAKGLCLSFSLLPCLLFVLCVSVCVHAFLHRMCHSTPSPPAPCSYRCLSPSDPPGTPDHHRPDARPPADPEEPRPRHHANHHASDSPDSELGPGSGSQPSPGTGAAGARVGDHLHAVRVPLHAHALHTGVPHRLHRSFRYVQMKSPPLPYRHNGCIMRTGYLASMVSAGFGPFIHKPVCV